MSFDDLDLALDLLGEDVDEAIARVNADASQFNRRTYVRTVFAFVEAACYASRQAAIAIMRPWVSFNPSNMTKIGLLMEEAPRILATGKIEVQKLQVPYLNYVAFSLRAMPDAIGMPMDKVFGDNGWNLFQKATAIRHRLTHPKIRTDAIVSDDELKIVEQAHYWFNKASKSVHQHVRQLESTEQLYE